MNAIAGTRAGAPVISRVITRRIALEEGVESARPAAEEEVMKTVYDLEQSIQDALEESYEVRD